MRVGEVVGEFVGVGFVEPVGEECVGVLEEPFSTVDGDFAVATGA